MLRSKGILLTLLILDCPTRYSHTYVYSSQHQTSVTDIQRPHIIALKPIPTKNSIA